MCDTFKVTARTLRFYEDKELLKPIREGQKRLYTRREMARIKLILRGKRLGFSLEQIRELLDLYYLGDKQKTQIQRTYNLGLLRLDEMQAQRTDLDDAIKELKERLQAGADWLERSEATQNLEA
ncbi:MAG: MerR family DNA-binding transcriptional regulator [Amylibacter sp.]|nr:MerR family DNA-binding transcriptional regulator [Amylibacter sp.]